jgi:hypothetical protein
MAAGGTQRRGLAATAVLVHVATSIIDNLALAVWVREDGACLDLFDTRIHAKPLRRITAAAPNEVIEYSDVICLLLWALS